VPFKPLCGSTFVSGANPGADDGHITVMGLEHSFVVIEEDRGVAMAFVVVVGGVHDVTDPSGTCHPIP